MRIYTQKKLHLNLNPKVSRLKLRIELDIISLRSEIQLDLLQNTETIPFNPTVQGLNFDITNKSNIFQHNCSM